MNAHPLRQQFDELAQTLAWLRTLAPHGQRYKLWLGDLVEFVNAAFGPHSPQMAEIRAILIEGNRPAADAGATERTGAYIATLDAFARVLAGFERHVRAPLIMLDPDDRGSP